MGERKEDGRERECKRKREGERREDNREEMRRVGPQKGSFRPCSGDAAKKHKRDRCQQGLLTCPNGSTRLSFYLLTVRCEREMLIATNTTTTDTTDKQPLVRYPRAQWQVLSRQTPPFTSLSPFFVAWPFNP